MDLDTEKIVLDGERAILQVERPGDWRPVTERADERCFESIFSVRRRRGKISAVATASVIANGAPGD